MGSNSGERKNFRPTFSMGSNSGERKNFRPTFAMGSDSGERKNFRLSTCLGFVLKKPVGNGYASSQSVQCSLRTSALILCAYDQIRQKSQLFTSSLFLAIAWHHDLRSHDRSKSRVFRLFFSCPSR